MIGRSIGHYEIVERLGEGGMGVVWKARDTRLGRLVALKVLPQEKVADADRKRRFVLEARAASALNHPNIVVIHDVGEHEGVDFIVLEYVAGKTLDQLIPAGGLPADRALGYAVQVAEALGCAHAAGIVHRDIKPSNIMVDDHGHVKVLDFGLAKLNEPPSDPGDETATRDATMAGTVVGTAAYMSPEQAEGRRVDARSDVFSFGSVLYEMLAGRKAFDGPSRAALITAVLRDQPTPIGEIRKDIPAELRRIVAGCLGKDAAGRYASGTELAEELRACREDLFPASGSGLRPGRILRAARRPLVLAPVVLVALALVVGSTWAVRRYREARWARIEALPAISAHIDRGNFAEAYALAVKAERAIPGDPMLAKMWPVMSYEVSLETTPSGAEVSRKEYGDKDAPWEKVGRTPLAGVRAPRGNFVWRFEKPGFAPTLRTTAALFGVLPAPGQPVAGSIALDEEARAPDAMVRVSPTASYRQTLFIPGYEGMPELPLADYWIDRYEVTNRQYRTFLAQGGYRERRYWTHAFVKDGRHLTWDEALALFLDATGRPGPKDWVQGDYPKGQDEYPVTGVSWYEAAAYAEFAGKSLPTIYHWNRAAGPFSAAFIVPASNFGGAGVLPVGSKQGMSPWGSYDMAGNVKEWIWNEADAGRRYVLGGAWDEPSYMFIDPDAQSPFLRAANVGFRCAKYVDPASVPKVATDPMPSPRRDLSKEKPVSDEVFRAYLGLYSYDKAPLNASVEPFGAEEEDWKTERVTYSAAYGNERAVSYLFLPKRARPPFQTVVFFPGSNALQQRSLVVYPSTALDAILKSGRAVLYPVYKGTYERADGTESDIPDTKSRWRDHVVMWTKDASRAIDYAESRQELDHEKLAYYGYSWGAAMGAIVPAVETRFKACVFALGGLEFQRSLPEVDPINFLPRVKQPVLMLNGRYDFFFPVDATQVPFYRMLGTPKDRKKQVIYDTGHSVPRNELIKETLDWLDRYLGPVK